MCLVKPQNYVRKKGMEPERAEKVEEMVCGGKGSFAIARTVDWDKKGQKDRCVVQCEQLGWVTDHEEIKQNRSHRTTTGTFLLPTFGFSHILKEVNKRKDENSGGKKSSKGKIGIRY